VTAHATPPDDVEIVPYEPAHRAAFRDLNRAWIEAYFAVEPADLELIEHPEHVLAAGGEIHMARRTSGELVGTAALLCHGDGAFEVAKMAVTPSQRGRGIGKRLLERLIERFEARGGTRLTLETNSKLAPALALYHRFGFVEAPFETPSEYARADLFLVWRGRG